MRRLFKKPCLGSNFFQTRKNSILTIKRPVPSLIFGSSSQNLHTELLLNSLTKKLLTAGYRYCLNLNEKNLIDLSNNLKMINGNLDFKLNSIVDSDEYKQASDMIRSKISPYVSQGLVTIVNFNELISLQRKFLDIFGDEAANRMFCCFYIHSKQPPIFSDTLENRAVKREVNFPLYTHILERFFLSDWQISNKIFDEINRMADSGKILSLQSKN